MAATATPVTYDPKCLAQDDDFSTSANTVLYTAPNEAGVKVESIIVCNKTAAAVTLTLKHYNGTTRFTICNAVNIPATGMPVDILYECGPLYLDANDVIDGSAGTASALDINVYGIEMAD